MKAFALLNFQTKEWINGYILTFFAIEDYNVGIMSRIYFLRLEFRRNDFIS